MSRSTVSSNAAVFTRVERDISPSAAVARSCSSKTIAKIAIAKSKVVVISPPSNCDWDFPGKDKSSQRPVGSCRTVASSAIRAANVAGQSGDAS